MTEYKEIKRELCALMGVKPEGNFAGIEACTKIEGDDYIIFLIKTETDNVYYYSIEKSTNMATSFHSFWEKSLNSGKTGTGNNYNIKWNLNTEKEEAIANILRNAMHLGHFYSGPEPGNYTWLIEELTKVKEY
jgi:hypothetical protein